MQLGRRPFATGTMHAVALLLLLLKAAMGYATTGSAAAAPVAAGASPVQAHPAQLCMLGATMFKLSLTAHQPDTWASHVVVLLRMLSCFCVATAITQFRHQH